MLCSSASISPVLSSGGDAGAPAGESGAQSLQLLQNSAVPPLPTVPLSALPGLIFIADPLQGADTVLSALRVFNKSVLQNPVRGVSYPHLTDEDAGEASERARTPGAARCPPVPASKALLLLPFILLTPPSRLVFHSTSPVLSFTSLPFSQIVSWGRCDKVPHPGDLAEDLFWHILGARSLGSGGGPGSASSRGLGIGWSSGGCHPSWYYPSAGGCVAPISAFVMRGLLSVSLCVCPLKGASHWI